MPCLIRRRGRATTATRRRGPPPSSWGLARRASPPRSERVAHSRRRNLHTSRSGSEAGKSGDRCRSALRQLAASSSTRQSPDAGVIETLYHRNSTADPEADLRIDHLLADWRYATLAGIRLTRGGSRAKLRVVPPQALCRWRWSGRRAHARRWCRLGRWGRRRGRALGNGLFVPINKWREPSYSVPQS
jgi:hypothetical protein